MQEVKITSAIAETIKANIDPSKYKKIYKEKQKQGTVTPYFFIRELETTQEEMVRPYVRRSCKMYIRYVAADNEYNRYETQAIIGNQLLLILRKIEVDGITYKGRDLEYKQSSGGRASEYKQAADCLEFFVTYTVIVKKDEDVPLQQSLEINRLKAQTKQDILDF